MKKQFITLFLILTIGSSYAQNVVIPDAIFFNRLKNNDSINTNKDNVITKAEAEAFSGTINVSGYNIKSLAGIEAFLNIKALDCSHNFLDTLDVSKNIHLKTLKCHSNKLKQLDLSQNVSLTYLICGGNLHTSFDFSANVELENLYCGDDSLLTGININKCVKLKILGVDNTSIANLDVSSNKQLKYLYCRNNLLTSIDLQHNTLLELLYCNNNQLTKLDISKNTKLWNLNCSHNEIDSLDLSQNDTLEVLFCEYNQINFLDISDKLFLHSVYCSSNLITELDISNCPKIEQLRCSNNHITIIKSTLSDTSLYYLNCDSNMLENNLELKHFKNIKILYARNIQADSISFKSNYSLGNVYLDNNSLTTLDLSSQSKMWVISCSKNKLNELKLSHITTLWELYCDSNQLTLLNAAKYKEVNKLTHLSCRGNDSLKVICVNDTAYASSNPNFLKDSAAVYSQDCALGIEEVTGHTSTILVYPNPSNGLFYISHISNNVYDAMVYNTMGSRLLEIKSQKGAKELDLSKHPNGIYLLQIQTAEGGMYYQKLVKE